MAQRSRRSGTVTSFDDPSGLGVVRDDDGSEFDFHCTAIVDGSRHIDEGIEVTFQIRPGHAGRVEAGQIAPAR